jgi:hypothetical protein
MKGLNFLLLSVLLLNQVEAAPQKETIPSCRQVVDAMEALTKGYVLPQYFQVENPTRQGGEFDVMQYFTVLDHLSLKEGVVLDYVYHFDGLGGYPILYTRSVEQPPYTTEADLPVGTSSDSYLQDILTDGSASGFFQFMVLAIMGRQFYLDWHANYNDWQIVCDRKAVRSLVSELNGNFGRRITLASLIRSIFLPDPTPQVSLDEQEVNVHLVLFTKWGGFYQETYSLSRKPPHEILETLEKNLVPYECGVMF